MNFNIPLVIYNLTFKAGWFFFFLFCEKKKYLDLTDVYLAVFKKEFLVNFE
jgi:hypothetical protein